MTGRSGQRRAWPAVVLAPAVALGLPVLVWAAAAGPMAVFSPSGRLLGERPTPPPATASAPLRGDSVEAAKRSVERTLDLSWIGDLLAWAVLLGLALVVVLLGHRVWQHRWRPPAPPEDVDVEVLPDARVAAALRQDASARLDAIAGGDPRNGIVRCWLRLEECMAAAGLPRERHETSMEYVVRVLHRLDLDPRAIGELATLYREARFSEHPVHEEARTRARAALDMLHADLTASGATR